MQNYGFSLIHGRIFPIFFNFAVKISKNYEIQVCTLHYRGPNV
jgi:hypothetical protein